MNQKKDQEERRSQKSKLLKLTKTMPTRLKVSHERWKNLVRGTQKKPLTAVGRVGGLCRFLPPNLCSQYVCAKCSGCTSPVYKPHHLIQGPPHSLLSQSCLGTEPRLPMSIYFLLIRLCFLRRQFQFRRREQVFLRTLFPLQPLLTQSFSMRDAEYFA